MLVVGARGWPTDRPAAFPRCSSVTQEAGRRAGRQAAASPHRRIARGPFARPWGGAGPAWGPESPSRAAKVAVEGLQLVVPLVAPLVALPDEPARYTPRDAQQPVHSPAYRLRERTAGLM
jgi:hypothetical protein